MIAKRLLLLLVGLLMCIPSAEAIDPVKLRGWIAYFEARDPVVDATKNQQKGTVYVIEAMGAGSYYPGLENYEQGDRIAKQYAKKHLPGTSDAIESDLHRRYIEIATDYASKYNQTTVKLLIDTKKP